MTALEIEFGSSQEERAVQNFDLGQQGNNRSLALKRHLKQNH